MRRYLVTKFAQPSMGIRLIRMGCVNRPFYQIGVLPFKRRAGLPPNEVIGSFDPMPNERNEKLLAVDLDRLAYWIGHGAQVSRGLTTMLGESAKENIAHSVYHHWTKFHFLFTGLSGFLPIRPGVYVTAIHNRRQRLSPEPSAEISAS